jgi:predicted transcriptional regulator
VFIQNANPSIRETIEAVLRLRGLTALLKEDQRVVVVGDLKRPMRETLDVLIQKKQVTSSDVASALDKNVNIVCNRLNALQRLGLVCRVRDGSVPGGGRQYYYESIV